MFMNRGLVDYYKNSFPPGTRIMLDAMYDDPRPIEPGTKGTVEFVDDAGTIHTTFDNGRHLGICPEVDRFHKIEQTETEEPQLSM